MFPKTVYDSYYSCVATAAVSVNSVFSQRWVNGISAWNLYNKLAKCCVLGPNILNLDAMCVKLRPAIFLGSRPDPLKVSEYESRCRNCFFYLLETITETNIVVSLDLEIPKVNHQVSCDSGGSRQLGGCEVHASLGWWKSRYLGMIKFQWLYSIRHCCIWSGIGISPFPLKKYQIFFWLFLFLPTHLALNSPQEIKDKKRHY